MPAALQPRSKVAGVELQMLVLAGSTRGCAAVDLGSGALVRARYRQPARLVPAAFDVVVARTIDDDDDLLDPSQPESVALESPPRRVGQLSVRRAERHLRPLLHPRGRALLGFAGPSVPYWMLRGDEPSLAIVAPDTAPVVVHHGEGLGCRFGWHGTQQVLPLDDRRLDVVLAAGPGACLGGTHLALVLGCTPRRLLVALTSPVAGHCYKVVATLLP